MALFGGGICWNMAHPPFFSFLFSCFFVNNSSYMRIQAFFPECRHVPSRFPSQEFSKNLFHLSVFTVRLCFIMNYGMKDVSGIFQFPFIVESGKKFSAK